MKEKECNARITEETAAEVGQDKKFVEEAVGHFAEFIATTIRSGNMDGVLIPYMGKIQMKPMSAMYHDYLKALTPEMRKLLLAPEAKNNNLKELFNP